jgi:hypothetical protein
MSKNDLMRWAAAFWLLLLFGLALSPLPVKLYLHTIGRFHSAGHTIAFFVTALLLLWNARGLRSEVLRFTAALALALLMEFLENLFYHSGFEWNDILIDLTGIITAWVIALVIRSGKAKSGSSASVEG